MQNQDIWTPPADAKTVSNNNVIDSNVWTPPADARSVDDVISASRSAGQKLANESDEIQEDVKNNIQRDGYKKDPEWVTAIAKYLPTDLGTIWNKRQMLSIVTKDDREEIKGLNNNIIAIQDKKAELYKSPEGKKILFAEKNLREVQKKLTDTKNKYEQAQGAYKQQLQSLYQNLQQNYNDQYLIYENTINNSGVVGQNYKKLNEEIDGLNEQIKSKNTVINQKADMFGEVGTIESMVNKFSTAMDDIQAQTYKFLLDDYKSNQGLLYNLEKESAEKVIWDPINKKAIVKKYQGPSKSTIDWLDSKIEENIAEKESAELRTLQPTTNKIDSFGDLMMAGYDELTSELPTLLGSSVSLMAPAILGIGAGALTKNPEFGILAGLTSQMIARYAESGAEASQTSQQAYDYLTENHPEMSHQEKTIRALELGQANFKNNMAIGLKDIPEFLLAVLPEAKFLGRLGKGVKMTRYKELLATKPILGNSIRFGGIMAAEGFEEGAQYLSNEYVQNFVRSEADKYDMSLSHVFSDKEFWKNVKGGAELGIFMSGAAHVARKIFSTDEPLTKKDIPSLLNEQENLRDKFIYKALDRDKQYWLTGTIRAEGNKANGIFSDMSITDEAERIKNSKAKALELIEEVNEKSEIYHSLKANKQIDNKNRRLGYYNQIQIAKLEKKLELLEKAPEVNSDEITKVNEAISYLKNENAEIGLGNDVFNRKATELAQEIQSKVKEGFEKAKQQQKKQDIADNLQQLIQSDIDHFSSFTIEDDGELAFNEAQKNLELLKSDPQQFYKGEVEKLIQDNNALRDKLSKATSQDDVDVLTLELQKNEETLSSYNEIVDGFELSKSQKGDESVTSTMPLPQDQEVPKNVPLNLSFLTQEDYDVLNEATDNMTEPSQVTDLVVDLFNSGKINLDQLNAVNSFFTDKITAKNAIKSQEQLTQASLSDEQEAAKQRFDEFINETLSQPTTDAALKNLLETNPVQALQDLIEWHKSQMKGKNQVTQQYHQNAIDKFQSLIDDYNLFTGQEAAPVVVEEKEQVEDETKKEAKEEVVILTKEQEKEKKKQEIKERREKARKEYLDELKTKFEKLKATAPLSFKVTKNITAIYDSNEKKYKYYNKYGEEIVSFRALKKYTYKISKKLIKTFFESLATAEQKQEMLRLFEKYQYAYERVMALDGLFTLEYVIMETISGKKFNPTDVKNNTTDINSKVWIASEMGRGIEQGRDKKGWSVDVIAESVMTNAESYGVGLAGIDEMDIVNMIYDIINENPNGITNKTLKEKSQKDNGIWDLQQIEFEFIDISGLNIEQASDFLMNIQNELYNQDKIEVNETDQEKANEVSIGENLGDTSVQEDILSAEGNDAQSQEGEIDVTDEEVETEDLEKYAREQGFSDLQHATFSWNKRLSTGQVTGVRKDVKNGERLTTKEEIDQAAKGSESADRQREERQNIVIKESDNTYTGYKNGKIVAFKTTLEEAKEAVFGKKEESKTDETKESKPSGATTKSRKQIEEEEKLAKEQTTREKVIDKLKAIKEAAQKRSKPDGSGTIALGGNVNLLADKILEKACDLAIAFVEKSITLEDAILQMSDYLKSNIADVKERFKQEVETYNFFDNLRKEINESAKGQSSEHDFQTVQQASQENVDNEQNFKAFTGDGEDKSKIALGKINPLINNIPGLPLKKAHALLVKILSDKNWNGKGRFSDNIKDNIALLYENGSLEERMLATRLQLILEFDEKYNQEKGKKLKRLLKDVEKQNRLVFLFNILSAFKTHPVWTLFQRKKGETRSMSMELTNAVDEIVLIKQVKEKMEQMGNETFTALFKELERKRQQYKNDNTLNKAQTFEAILNAEIAFLKDVTGIDFTDWLNRKQWLSYTDTQGVEHKFNNYMDLYKHKGSNSYLYNMLINKISGTSKNYHTKSTNAPVANAISYKNLLSELTYKSRLGKGNPINQLLAEKKLQGNAELAESYKNVKNKTKTASIMQSALRRKFDNIAKIARLPFYEDNEWVQFNKKGILYSFVEGIKNVPGNTGNSQRELTSNDLKSIMINAWLDGNDKSFMMPAGKLGDRDIVMMLNAKKYGENGKAKLAEIDPSVTEDEIDEAVIQFMNLNKSPLNTDSYITGLTEQKARQFVYDYFINKHFIDLFIHGRTSQYGKPGKVEASTDMVKRSASVSSSGTELNLTIEGGLGKTHNQIVISKIVAPDGTALADGQEFVTADHADKYQVSSGTDVSQPESIRWWHTIKDIVDYTTSKGKRFLSKTNKIVIDLLAEMDIEIFNAENGTDYTIDNFDFDKYPDAKELDYLAIYQFMKNNNADRLSTLDGVKFPIGKAVKLYKESVDEDGTVTMSIDRDVLKQKFEAVDAESEEAENAYNITHSNENIIVQQDLRNPGLPKESNESKQEYKNFIQFAEAEELAKINNRITAILTSELFEFLKDATPRELRNFLLNVDLDEIEDISEEDFEFDGNIAKDLMKLGVDVLHPFNNKTAMTMFANRAGKEILGRKILKSLLVEVARLGHTLEEMRVENNKVYLGEVLVPESLGLRKHEYYATKEEAEKEVYENGKLKSKYFDLKGFEHEIKVKNGKWIVPGEPANVTRIPADAPHSHNMLRVAGYTPAKLKNIIITNTGAQRIAGPDFDGDQRHVQQFFKALGEIITADNYKKIANQKIADKLKKKLLKVKNKEKIAEITKEVTDKIMNDMTVKYLSNEALYYKLKANYNLNNFDKWMDALDLSQADETFDKLKGRLKKYNKNNPLFFIDSDAKARVGLKVVGIGSLFIGNYNIANKIGANMINAIDFPNISIDANGNLTFGKAYKIKNFAKESKAMGNFLNLALDNLKELKIEILGLNDVTAKMYFTLLALRPQEIENQFKKQGMTESEAKDAAEKKWIDNVAGFFNHPMVQEWINAVRTNNDTGKTKLTPKQIINKLYDEFAPLMEYTDVKKSGKIIFDYEYDITMSPETLNTDAQTTQMQQQKANATIIKMIEKLNSIAGDLEVLQQAIKMTEYDGMPNTFTKYLLQKQAWNKLTSSDQFVKLRNLNTSMVKDSVYFASVLKAFEAFEAYINNNSLEMTKTGKEIFDLFREAKTSPEAMLINDSAFENATFMDKEIDAISKGIYNSALSIAIENNEEPAVTKKKVMDWFESLPEDSILANILSAEEKEVGDKVFKRVELAEAFRRNMPDDILNDAKNEFAELPENEKKLLLKYFLNEFGGISTGTFTGNFSVLIDDNTHIDIGNKMREMFDKFNQNTNLAQDIYNRIIENDQNTKENIFDYVETIDEEGKKKRASYAGIGGMAAKDYGQREVSNVAYENLKAGKELTTSTAFSKDDTMEYVNKETGESFLAKITSVKKGAEKGKYIITVEETDKKAGEEIITTTETTEMTNKPSEYTNHSGGAYGGDTFWDIIGRMFGVTNHKHYKDAGNQSLSKQLREAGVQATVLTKEQMDTARAEIGKLLGIKYSDDLQGNLQVRNYYQVANSDAVFAIAKLNTSNNTVSGGTNTAVQLGIKLNKPVYVWDINTEKWYSYDANTKQFMSTETPTLTKNFAGVGSRDIESYNVKNKQTGAWETRKEYIGKEKEEKAKQAIRDVYEQTFSKTVQTTTSQLEIATSDEIAMADKLTPIEQNFSDGQGGRKMQSQFKGKSTMDLIISGDRTRTTRANTDIQRMARDYGLSKISDLIGKVIRMTDKQGRQVYTRITNVAPFTQEYQDATWQQEGWAKDVTDNLVGKYPYAIEFKVVSAPQATTEGKVSDVDQEFNDLMNEWNKYKDELMKKDPDMAFEHWAMMSAEERKKMIDCL